jgi:hypothetical protein
MGANLSDHVAALLKSSTDPFPESLATIFLDSALVCVLQGDVPRAWSLTDQAIRTLCGDRLSPVYLPMTVHLTTANATTGPDKGGLYIILEQGLHVCPWTRIHIILSSAMPWKPASHPDSDIRPLKRMRDIMVANGATSCEGMVTACCYAMREGACSQMGDCLDTLLRVLPLVPRTPGTSPWTIAIFARHCLHHSVTGPRAAKLIGSAPVC